MEDSSQAGRLWGRARARPVFSSILTPDFCEYAIDARLISAKKYEVRDEVIIGRGHARRDAFALLFPPTTLYQLIRIPARGPELSIGEEEQLVIKLIQPVYPADSESNQITGPAPIGQTPRAALPSATVSKSPGLECQKISSGRMVLMLTARMRILRSFQNTTPYDVVVYANGTPIGTIAPCSESVLALSRRELKLKAIATVPEDNGQREVEAVLGLNEKSTGWQVLSLHDTGSKIR